MAYRTQDIDRGIVMTQANLQGFFHPTGIRFKPGMAKGLWYTTMNLPVYMAGANEHDPEVDDTYVSVSSSDVPYNKRVEMAKAMAEACDAPQVEAIENILDTITNEMDTLRKLRNVGEYDGPEVYVCELTTVNLWGATVLALYEGFDEEFEKLRVQKKI